MWCIHMQTEIERLGVPTVSVITTPFIMDAKSAAELFGMPAVRRVVIPHPVAYTADEELYNKVENAFNDIVAGLTSPLSGEDLKAGLKKAQPRKRIICKATAGKAHQYFSEMGLSDGLPIIPPTEEKVQEMLKNTSHPPEKVIGQMPPEKWIVTVEKVAVNGVMAGCLPEYMPVLLALAEALIDPVTATETYSRSTTSFAFWSMVNGPVAKQIGMNAEGNALGPGNIANATIGRAIRLFINNLGGSNPGVNDMSSQGSALKYGFSFTENEKDSPWEPFHVSHGFGPEESTITVFKSWGFRSTSLTVSGGLGLSNMAWTAQTVGGRGIVILMDPLLAKQLAADGLNKKDVQQFMWQSLRWSVKEWKDSLRDSLIVASSELPKWYEYLAPDTTIPRFLSPDCIEIIVVGGQNNPFYQIFEGVSPAAGTTKSVDKWK